MTTPSLLDNYPPRSCITYALSGDSTLTLHSRRTGRRFTYRIQKAPILGINLYHIDLLLGLTNESTLYPLGRIEGMTYHYSTYSPIPSDHEANLAFAFYWHNIQRNRIHPDLEIIHAQNPKHA